MQGMFVTFKRLISTFLAGTDGQHLFFLIISTGGLTQLMSFYEQLPGGSIKVFQTSLLFNFFFFWLFLL